MNLYKLSLIQQELDATILSNHPLKEGEDRIVKKIVALQQELAEVVQELPEVFKFWSNKKNNYEAALKEFVDGWHFILSIGNDIGFNFQRSYSYNNTVKLDLADLICDLNLSISIVYENNGYHNSMCNEFESVVRTYISLQKKLGFSEQQIIDAYMEKNAINYKRQEEGY